MEFGGARYVVGVAVDSVDVDGTAYAGIATDAPAYAALQGRRSGDAVELNGQEHRLDLVC